jgi:hypothetical protein
MRSYRTTGRFLSESSSAVSPSVCRCSAAESHECGVAPHSCSGGAAQPSEKSAGVMGM